jgi:hypothetical protein
MQGREIKEKNVKPHHKDKSYYLTVDSSPVRVVDIVKSREVRQEPLARLKKRPVGVEYVRPDGFSMRHRTDSARIKDGRTLDKGMSFPPKTGPLFLETEGGCDGSETTFGRRHTEAAA